MEFPDGVNGNVLRRMQASGFDFSTPHEIEFFAVFPTEEAADIVARMYVADDRHDSLTNIETKPEESGGMELVVAVRMLATYENITGFESEFHRRTTDHGGHLDGWGVLQA